MSSLRRAVHPPPWGVSFANGLSHSCLQRSPGTPMFAPQTLQIIDEQVAEGATESAAYRLLSEAGSVIVERRVQDRQAVSHVIFLTARDAPGIGALLFEDETFAEAKYRADRLFRKAAPSLLAAQPAAALPDDPFELLAVIAPGSSQFDTEAALRKLGSLCGLPSFVAIWLRRHGAQGEISTRLLAGCAPNWVRSMVRKRWCVTDPLVVHARARNEVVASWQIARLSAGQTAAAALAAECGFRVSVCFPAHEAGGHASLALVFGGETQPEARRFHRQIVPLLQTAALRLLGWCRERRWREEHGAVALSETQSKILTLLAQDFTTMEIARTMGEPEGRVMYHIKRLRLLFNARSGVEVAMRAMEAGLIDPLDPA